ncbi:DUF502 domain-containing protein [Fontivita pretiosa]|uniref:DUF502 domain-containing protein n=1 Tax=Fontivita pretiosa TaxID=2989684 RepID=UPI003D16989D
MQRRFQTHLRNTFLAGIFAALPVAITIFLIVQVDAWTRGISNYLFGKPIPFLGALIAIVAVYVVGVLVTLSIGKWALAKIDALLERLPVIKPIYRAWKQISLTPGGGEGMFARVVLVPDETGQMRTLGFTSGQGIPGDPDTICVFVPNAPNPIQGKLYFAARNKARMTALTSEEAFKLLLSTGNYVPEGCGKERNEG